MRTQNLLRWLPLAALAGSLVGCAAEKTEEDATGGTGAGATGGGSTGGSAGSGGSTAGAGGSTGGTGGATGGTGGTGGATGGTGGATGGTGGTTGGTGGATGGTGGATGGTGGTGGSVSLVDVSIESSVLLANNSTKQFDPLFAATFNAGSGMGRLKLWARFCNDAACNDPVAVVRATVDGEDSEGYNVYSNASTSGSGFDKDFIIPQAPIGTYYLQLIGDSQRSELAGKGLCSTTSDCPGDADVLQMDGYQVNQTGSGSDDNPAPYTQQVTVSAANETVTLSGVQYLGHLYFSGQEIWTPAPADTGKLMVAVSNAADDARNTIGFVDLADASATPGTLNSDSYTLRKNGADFTGDVCGLIEGGTSLFAIGVDGDGANIFELSASDGSQLSDAPIVTVPPTDPGNANTYPWPCRGVYAEKNGKKQLYLINFKGAGSQTTSSPHPLVHVNVTDKSYTTPFDAYTDWAWRGIAVDQAASQLVVAEMSWSVDAGNSSVSTNRLVPIPLDVNGTPGAVGTVVTTDVASNNTCSSTANWPSDVKMVTLGGNERVLLGHDEGIAIYDPASLGTKVQDLDLLTFGNLFSQVASSPDGSTLYALPQCKANNANHNWELPYGVGTENADKNLIAILEDNGGQLAVRTTTIDVNGDGTPDHGVDLDYYRIKSYIRTFDSTLPIPPVVYTGPRMVAGNGMLFVRGSGTQGNGGATISSSGLGQAQDVSFFDLSTGHGVVFDGYMPFFDGLSSGAGTGNGIWGYDIRAGQESSVGALHYLSN